MRNFSVFVLFFFISFFAYSENSQNRRVKIPVYDYDALYQKMGNEKESSYLTEFLENLNRYSDFEFEYVPVERSQLAQSLKSGKIDMIPFFGRNVDTSGEILVSDIPCAIGSAVFASNHMPDMDNLRIGILNHGPENLREKVFSYVKNQKINASYFYYDSSADLISDIYNGKIDVFTTIDFTIPNDFFVIATLENTFFYLAVSASNQELFDELNASLSTIFLLNPAFLSTLRSRYIPSARYSINKLSPKEQNYIKNNKTLKVAALMNQSPYSSLIDGNFRGIIIDLINQLAKTTGFSVTYVPAYSYHEAMNLVKFGEADILYCVNELLPKADLKSIKPTSHLLSQKMICVCRSDFKKDEESVFVKIKGMSYLNEFIDGNFNVSASVNVDTSKECFELVEKNKNYFTLMPSQEADFYLQNHLFTNLTTQNEGYMSSISLGLSRRLGNEVAGALDKAIYALTTSMFESFMERNMEENLSFAAFVKKHLVLFCIISAAFILVLASSIFLLVIFETRRRKDNQIKQAMNLANRDSMTGLFNHIAFEKKVTGILTHQEENETGVFVMIDIDDFKRVNDSLGHAKGDYVIVSVANLLLSTFRGGDLKGRMGGDEFAVFMRNVSDLGAVEHKIKILQESIKSYFEESELTVNVTCSIGISWCKGKQNEDSFKEIYNAADKGLYQVKKNGKNAFVIVEPTFLQS